MLLRVGGFGIRIKLEPELELEIWMDGPWALVLWVRDGDGFGLGEAAWLWICG